MKMSLGFTVAGFGLAVFNLSAGTCYVDVNSANPTPPYANWATAARVIQDAVDAALAGAEIVVSNGLYATGGRAVGTNLLINRVAVDKPLVLRSVNGPQLTFIHGSGLVRCVYLAESASLCGFTLTNGIADDGAGVWCESASAVVSNCVMVGNSASRGGGASGGTLRSCVLSNNLAHFGGGACGGTLEHCLLSANSATSGGGAYADSASACTLIDCTMHANAATDGGGVYASLSTGSTCTLTNCTLSDNSAQNGGGVYAGGYSTSSPCVLERCTLRGNLASYSGGGVSSILYFYGPGESCVLNNCQLVGNRAGDIWQQGGGGACGGTLNNCVIAGNSSGRDGGGVFGWIGFSPYIFAPCVLSNCTVAGNFAANSGGGACGYGDGSCTLNNCTVYFNTATNGANYFDTALNYSCTTPMPTNGAGNITNAPLFVDYAGGDLHLQSNSPCINAGLNAYAPGLTDLDGLPRIVRGTVDIGAYEFQGPGSAISYAWLQHYGLPTDGSADFVDQDADGHNTWQEWRCGTCPTNALSALRLLAASPTGTNVTVSWQSVSGVNYFLERTTELAMPFTPVVTDLPGQSGTTSFTDTNAVGQAPIFYRAGVSGP